MAQGLLQAVARHTEGNPLFVIEVARQFARKESLNDPAPTPRKSAASSPGSCVASRPSRTASGGLWLDSLIREVSLKHQEVAVCLTPPLSGLGFLSTSLAPRGIEPRSNRGLLIHLRFNLDSGCSGSSDAMNIFPLEHLQYVCYMYKRSQAWCSFL